MAKLAPGAIIAGRYRIDQVMDQGPPAAMCAASRLSDGLPVTLKILSSVLAKQHEHRARFEREVDAMTRLRHPAVPQVLEFSNEGEDHFLALEVCNGETLAARLARLGGLPFGSAIFLLDWLLEVLEAVHQSQIVHRDLNPKNLVFAPGPHGEILRLVDFRSARIGEAAFVPGQGWIQLGGPQGKQQAVTQLGATVGTAEYQAPEQIKGGAIDGRTDLYQVGCVAYAMLTGEPPFTGKSAEVMGKQVKEEPQPPAQRRPDLQIPPGLDAWVVAMLRKPMEARFLGAKTAREALRVAMEQGSLPSWALGPSAGPDLQLAGGLRPIPQAHSQPSPATAATATAAAKAAGAPAMPTRTLSGASGSAIKAPTPRASGDGPPVKLIVIGGVGILAIGFVAAFLLMR